VIVVQRVAIHLLTATLSLAVIGSLPAAPPPNVDLVQWTPPDITTVGQDASGMLIMYGYVLLTDTANQIGPTVADPRKRYGGNSLTCQNCHLRAGTQPYAMPLIGIWGQFPQYRAREGHIDTLEERINGCMERSLNGRPLPPQSREMQGLTAYMRWLSNGIPAGARLIGARTLRIKEPARAADTRRGARVYSETCSPCHGPSGAGVHAMNGAGYQIPPLWGADSYNNGAGMARILIAAAYAMHNMPLGTKFTAPLLTDDDAYDVAGYLVSQDRPVKSDLEKDYPIRLQKPVDSPYGPYGDGFTQAQHALGPFGPIRARVRELTEATAPTDSGGPDNGSGL
jgi:thiosulfate dehydrogenase